MHFYSGPPMHFTPASTAVRPALALALGVNPFSITDGVLMIRAARPPRRSGLHRRPALHLGMITTETSFTQTYGHFEMPAPLSPKQGVWPAFRLLPADRTWPPERG